MTEMLSEHTCDWSEEEPVLDQEIDGLLASLREFGEARLPSLNLSTDEKERALLAIQRVNEIYEGRSEDGRSDCTHINELSSGEMRRLAGILSDYRSGTSDSLDPALAQEAAEALRSLNRIYDAHALDTVDIKTPSEGKRYGHFTLQSKLGGGGLGEVWVARDDSLDREVVVKILRSEHSENARLQKRLTEEAHISGQLEHPNIVPVYHAGVDEDGNVYYAMKYVHGRTMSDVVEDSHSGERSLFRERYKLLQLLGSFIDVCNAVDFAHSRGILHKDIKPANIVLGEHGQTILLDWGLADRYDKAPRESARANYTPDGNPQFSYMGNVSGTPAYMPPEQAAGRVDRMDPRSDVYSLGAVLYEMLSGAAPYKGSPVEIIRKVVNEEPIDLRMAAPGAPRALAAICRKAMAKNKEDRYESAKDLVTDIKRYIAGEAIEAESGIVYRAKAWLSQRLSAIAVGAATLMVGLGGLVFHSAVTNRDRDRAEMTRKAESNLERRARIAKIEEMFERGREALDMRDYPKAITEMNKAIGACEATPGLDAQLDRAKRYVKQIELLQDFAAGSGTAAPIKAIEKALAAHAELESMLSSGDEGFIVSSAERAELGRRAGELRKQDLSLMKQIAVSKP